MEQGGDEVMAYLKMRLQSAIYRDQPLTTLDFRLCALRLAEQLATELEKPQSKDQLYDVFKEMMDIDHIMVRHQRSRSQ